MQTTTINGYRIVKTTNGFIVYDPRGVPQGSFPTLVSAKEHILNQLYSL